MASAEVSFPPGPRLPALVQTMAFIVAPARFMRWCRERYGDIVTLGTAFDQRFVMVFTPELVKEVFRASPERLRAGEANALLGPALGQRSVLLLDGAEHLRQRKLLLPPFHGQRMLEYASVMLEATDRVVDTWPVGEEFPLMPAMQELTLEVIMRAVFGVEAGERQVELKRRVRAMIQPLSRRLGILVLAFSGGRMGDRGAMARFVKNREQLDELIYAEIARRRSASDLAERTDILSMLLQARDEAGEPMTDGELRDELVTLLVAGHETTATGLAWAFDLVLRDPRVLAAVRAGATDEYVDAVVKEALRIRPVIPGVGRVVRGGPFEIGGYRVPDGVEINPSIATIHTRGDVYADASRFLPERFLGPDAPDTYTWIPFGGGTRRCLGASFATFEMRVVLRRVLERAALRPASRRPDRPERRGITIVPKRGVRVVLERPPAAA
ncbi:MAG: cytochrome [Solirubrobacterales bacterium]|nr:cytochrome [Solirubrobacterales bacterium]